VYGLRSLEAHRGTEAWANVDPMLAAIVDSAASGISAVDVVKAQDACHRMNLRLVELFHDVRILVTPTCAAPPPPRSLNGMGRINGKDDPNWVRFTYPFNMTRSPAATVCVGRTSAGLPVGLQLIGPQHGDLVVLRSAAALEAAIGFADVPSIAEG
jgi:aspartyl-tRNA(Asn)/glutamyl-tRNA(Gln) amidotransferase subunit A